MAYPNKFMTDLSEEIIPDSIIIKSIPYNLTTFNLLHFMSQMKVPSPSSLNYLYNGFGTFRGIAFATFASSDEARQVVQQLNNYHLLGRRLIVEFKRKRLHTIARENDVQKTSFQPKPSCSHADVRENNVQKPSIQSIHCCHIDVPENANSQPKVSLAPRSTREQTPPWESYEMLMSYQNEPIEKEKLRRFLIRTGDYRKAINEYAKNRVRESIEGGYRTSVEIPPRLEMRPATPGELEEIAEMESRLELGGEGSPLGPPIKHAGEQNGTHVRGDRSRESFNISCLEKKQEASFPEEGAK